MLVRFFKTFKNSTYNSCKVIKIGEQVDQGLKDALQKKSGLGQMAFRWRNRIFEEKKISALELCFQHSGGGKKKIKNRA